MRGAPTPATDAPERVRGAATVVVEGRNCWRIARASRVAFLVDADAYFRALTQTLLRARRQVLILGWDIQAGARLLPRHMPDGLPPDLRGFLNALVARRRSLDVHLLGWDFSLVFALERASTFLLGTVLGMAPAVALFAVLAHMLWP
jgi:phosphatidylserine/phosphatidylglycerophosphate/cardiolipin synthase-like enzyme